jgi:DNA-binding transcriptional LysR family regulator
MPFDGRLLAGVSVLAAVIEGGSFVRAADALGMTASGVSRAVARLEQRVGVRLVNRTTRSVTLTDEGRRFYDKVGPLLEGIEEAAMTAAGSAGAVRGRLRVNVDPFFTRFVLDSQLAAFLDRYPELSLELFTSDHIGDLIAEGFDLAVRFGEPPDTSLIRRKLIETRVLTVASRSYVAQHGRPAHPTEVAGHACIHFRNPVTGHPFDWEFHRGREVITVETTGRLLLSDVGAQLSACVAGAGIAQIMLLGAEHLVESGDLINLFPEWSDELFPLYALFPSKHLPAAKVRAFLDFCTATMW